MRNGWQRSQKIKSRLKTNKAICHLQRSQEYTQTLLIQDQGRIRVHWKQLYGNRDSPNFLNNTENKSKSDIN